MYSVMKKRVEILRRRAVKKQMPTEYLSLVDVYISKANHRRNMPGVKQVSTDYQFNRALTYLLQAEDLLRACTQDTWTRVLNHRANRDEGM